MYNHWYLLLAEVIMVNNQTYTILNMTHTKGWLIKIMVLVIKVHLSFHMFKFEL